VVEASEKWAGQINKKAVLSQGTIARCGALVQKACTIAKHGKVVQKHFMITVRVDSYYMLCNSNPKPDPNTNTNLSAFL